MPRLLVFAPCEKTIISGAEAGDGSASLISIIQAINAQVGEDRNGGKVEKAVAPMRWHIFSLWLMEADDTGRSYEQDFKLTFPSGKTAFKQTIRFTQTKQFQRVVAQIIGFPVSESGEYGLSLHLREAESEIPKVEAYFPLFVAHVKHEIAEQAGGESVQGIRRSSRVSIGIKQKKKKPVSPKA
jgi:hypothetical protein